MTLYRFTVEERRYATLWIEGDDEAAAMEDAEILGSELSNADWDDVETDIDCEGEASPTRKVNVWSGGPDGHDYVYDPAASR